MQNTGILLSRLTLAATMEECFEIASAALGRHGKIQRKNSSAAASAKRNPCGVS
jgi:hypothetical protein